MTQPLEQEIADVIALDQPTDTMAELARLVSILPAVPRRGEDIAVAMEEAFNTTADDALRLAREGVANAEATLRETEDFARAIRDSGKLLGAKIRAGAQNCSQIASVMRTLHDLISRPPAV